MEITLVRTKFTDKETRGVLGCGNIFFGYTIEPVHFSNASSAVTCALPEGEYVVTVKNNPIAGVPCIKVIGVDYSTSASIRCSKPVGRKSNGIALLSKEDSTGDPAVVDIEAWTKLLDFIVLQKEVTLIIK